jgi:hypothetical protein
MRFTIVRSGDAFGSGGRFNTCFRGESAYTAVLNDCGASTMVALGTRRIEASRTGIGQLPCAGNDKIRSFWSV